MLLSLSSCSKEEITVDQEQLFCEFVAKEEYNNLLPLINNYLSNLDNNNTDKARLEQLAIWLKSKSCVSDAEVECNMCVYSLPPQGHLRVQFNSTVKQLNVVGTEPITAPSIIDY